MISLIKKAWKTITGSFHKTNDEKDGVTLANNSSPVCTLARNIDPLLHDELTHRRTALLVELKQWALDYGVPPKEADPALYANLMTWVLHLPPHPDETLRFQGVNKALVCDLHAASLDGDTESMLKLSEHYLAGKYVPEDRCLSFRLVRLAAEQGCQSAYPVLGKHYAYGIGTSRNPGEAVRWFLRSDYSQDADILEIMAWAHLTGTGVPQDEAKAHEFHVEAALRGHPEAFRFLEEAANAGNARGQYYFGLGYQQGIGTPADIKQALHWYHKAAEQGYAPAQCRLGILYSEGEFGIEKDPETAVQWYRLAAAQNDFAARSRLADCLYLGAGTEQNIEEAARILRVLAAESPEYPKGEPTSQARLGLLLTDNEYAGYAPKEGVKFLRRAAEQHNSAVQTTLGLHYYNGFEDIVKQDKKEARSWLHKAAKQGNYEAQYYLGEIYSNGDGVPASRKDAFKWYKQSADAGYAPAQQKVAHCYLNGIGTRKNEDEGYLSLALLALWGDEETETLLKNAAASGNAAAECGMWIYCREKKETEASLHWLESAATKGNARALCAMAFLHEQKGDNEQKIRCFRLAAEKGDAEAQTQLGLALEKYGDEREHPQNKEAFEWMMAAAKQDHPEANYFMGNFWRDGTGVEPDYQKAFECYSKAAELGSSNGIERVGEFYMNGIVVPQNDDMAFRCFQRSAELENPKGQCLPGICYLHGTGCTQDTELALQWISQAANTGHPAVYQLLQQEGLDIEKLSGGIKQFRKNQNIMEGNAFGENFDRIFEAPNKPIQPMPPGMSD